MSRCFGGREDAPRPVRGWGGSLQRYSVPTAYLPYHSNFVFKWMDTVNLGVSVDNHKTWVLLHGITILYVA